MKTSACFCVFLIVSLLSGIDCIRWKLCGGSGKVSDVKVSGCETDPICNLKKGQSSSFAVTFANNEAVTSATAVVHGIVMGLPVPFPLDNPNACKDSGMTCPLDSGTRYTYSNSVYISPKYPKVKLVVKYEVKDQNGSDLFCVEIPVQITDGSKKDTRNLSFLRKL
jgi:Niemann-Pick C2 protein